MLRSGGDQVDAGRLHAGMTQHVSELGNVPANFIKCPGEQVPQIVGEHFGRGYPSRFTQGLHLCPNLLSGHGLSVSGEEELAGGGFVFSGEFEQLFP